MMSWINILKVYLGSKLNFLPLSHFDQLVPPYVHRRCNYASTAQVTLVEDVPFEEGLKEKYSYERKKN